MRRRVGRGSNLAKSCNLASNRISIWPTPRPIRWYSQIGSPWRCSVSSWWFTEYSGYESLRRGTPDCEKGGLIHHFSFLSLFDPFSLVLCSTNDLGYPSPWNYPQGTCNTGCMREETLLGRADPDSSRTVRLFCDSILCFVPYICLTW